MFVQRREGLGPGMMIIPEDMMSAVVSEGAVGAGGCENAGCEGVVEGGKMAGWKVKDGQMVVILGAKTKD